MTDDRRALPAGAVGAEAATATRRATLERATKETRIRVVLDVDGHGEATVATGIGFLDHMLVTLARFARFDLTLTCEGDLHVDDHHAAEDCALTLGSAIDRALGDRVGIRRFGHAYAPLDEALVRAAIDFSGRPFADVALGLRRERIGEVACENIEHFFRSLAVATRATLHVDALKGYNDHHRSEAAFKATALALRDAVRREGGTDIPSTKGSL